MNNSLTPKNISKYLDHTCVKVDATKYDIKKICEEALKYNFHSVCVTPYRVKDAKKYLRNNSKKWTFKEDKPKAKDSRYQNNG